MRSLLLAGGAVLTTVGAWRLRTAHGERTRRLAATRASYRYTPPSPAQPCGPLAARLLGERGRPVVLLHGLAGSSRFWGAEYERLAGGHRLVAPDLLGFGASPRPASGYSLAEHAAAVVGCLDAAGMGVERAVVVGHSFGALVALALAQHHPERVGGIVAISPPLYPDAARARACMLRALSRAERILAMDTVWAGLVCRNLCSRRPRLAQRVAIAYRPELPTALARDGVRHSWNSYSQSLAELLGATARAEWATARGVPLTLITGGGDLLPDLDHLAGLAAGSPWVSLEVAPGADHLLPLSAVERCLEMIEGMAQRLDAAA